MRNKILFLLGLVLLISLQTGNSQIIRGTIMDAANKSPVIYATVYIDGSFVATYSDQQGRFELDISDYTSMPLIVSALGYYSVTLTRINPGEKLVIHLKPKVFELNEVLVSAKGSKRLRARNLKLFKSQFLGETYNSTRCDILNEDDIAIQNNRNSDTVRAYASKPITIRNKALGYTVTYFLDNFEYCVSDKLLDMKGNILFAEDKNATAAQKKQYEKRRKSTFTGSRVHFFRALWAGTLKEDGFKMSPQARTVNYFDLPGHIDTIPELKGLKILVSNATMPLRYYVDHKSDPLGSVMILNSQFVIFKENGYYDGTAIIWEGEMARQRVADWLPYEYKLEKK